MKSAWKSYMRFSMRLTGGSLRIPEMTSFSTGSLNRKKGLTGKTDFFVFIDSLR